MATRSGRYDIVEFLLQQGAKPDARKQVCEHSPIFNSIENIFIDSNFYELSIL